MASHGSLIMLAIKVFHITCLDHQTILKLTQSFPCGNPSALLSMWDLRGVWVSNTDHGGRLQVLELRGLERESSDQRCMLSSPFGNLIVHYRLRDWHSKLLMSLLWAWLMGVNLYGPVNWELWPIHFLGLLWENQPWTVMTRLTQKNHPSPFTHTYTHRHEIYTTYWCTHEHTHTHKHTPISLSEALFGHIVPKWHHGLLFPITAN